MRYDYTLKFEDNRNSQKLYLQHRPFAAVFYYFFFWVRFSFRFGDFSE